MTRLNWDAPTDRRFRAGVDRGVYYPKPDGSFGFAWPGLISVTVNEDGAENKPIYMNGYVVAHHRTPSAFSASIEALQAPDSFNHAAGGRKKIARGLSAHNQARTDFDFSFRTMQGDNALGTASEYVIHLVYGASAVPAGLSHSTIADTEEPEGTSWEISAVPLRGLEGLLPTPYLTIDTYETHPYLVNQIEQVLYGVDGDDGGAQMIDPELAIEILSQDYPEYFRNYCINPTFEGTTGWNYSTTSTELEFSSEWGSDGFSSAVIRRTNTTSESCWIEMTVPKEKAKAYVVVFAKLRIDERVGESQPRIRVKTYDGAETYSDIYSEHGVHQIALIHKNDKLDEDVYVQLALNYLVGKGNTGDQVAYDDIVVMQFDTEAEAEEGLDILAQMGGYFDGDRDDGKWGYGEWDGLKDGSESVYRSFGTPYDSRVRIRGFGIDPFGLTSFGGN